MTQSKLLPIPYPQKTLMQLIEQSNCQNNQSIYYCLQRDEFYHILDLYSPQKLLEIYSNLTSKQITTIVN